MIGLLMSFLTTSFAFADEVYVTKNGKKYHKKICSWIKNKDAVAISKEEAVEKGLTPCKRCYKEDVVVNEGQEEKIEDQSLNDVEDKKDQEESVS